MINRNKKDRSRRLGFAGALPNKHCWGWVSCLYPTYGGYNFYYGHLTGDDISCHSFKLLRPKRDQHLFSIASVIWNFEGNNFELLNVIIEARAGGLCSCSPSLEAGGWEGWGPLGVAGANCELH